MASNSSSSSSSESSSSSGVIESPFAILEAIEAAIIAVANNQSYQLGDRKVTRANLGELIAARKDLKREINQLQGNNRPVSYADLRL